MDGQQDLIASQSWRVLDFMTGSGGLWLAGIAVAVGLVVEAVIVHRAVSRWKGERAGRKADEAAQAASLAAMARKAPERMLVRSR